MPKIRGSQLRDDSVGTNIITDGSIADVDISDTAGIEAKKVASSGEYNFAALNAGLYNKSLTAVTTSLVAIHTAPVSGSVIHSLYIPNTDGLNSVDITVEFYDSSATTSLVLANAMPVLVGSILSFDKPINLESGDELRIKADVAARAMAFGSIFDPATPPMNVVDASLATTSTLLYTVPAATVAAVHSLYIPNIHATNSGMVSIEFFDASATATITLAKNIPVPVNNTFIFDRQLNLEAGDQLKVYADAVSTLGAFASIIEVT